MNITYRTRRRLQTIGTIALFVVMLIVIGWFCWVVWLERYIVYTRDGATIDFSVPQDILSGEVAVPPEPGQGPEIHYNEGENAISTSTDLTQLNGYYITADMLKNDLEGVQKRVATLPTGTAVMIELKAGYGSFYYSSQLEGAVTSSSVDVVAVDQLIQEMKAKNLYLIAEIPAFRDYTYGLNNHANNVGITYTGGGGALWADDGGCYWLKPTHSGVLGYVTSVILELRGMGFKEVVLRDFEVPNGKKVIYEGDEQADLAEAAGKLLTACTASNFTLSFIVESAEFALPEGRARMYMQNVSAKDVERYGSQVAFEAPQLHLVFLADTKDTRYDTYGVLRSLDLIDLETEEE